MCSLGCRNDTTCCLTHIAHSGIAVAGDRYQVLIWFQVFLFLFTSSISSRCNRYRYMKLKLWRRCRTLSNIRNMIKYVGPLWHHFFCSLRSVAHFICDFVAVLCFCTIKCFHAYRFLLFILHSPIVSITALAQSDRITRFDRYHTR